MLCDGVSLFSGLVQCVGELKTVEQAGINGMRDFLLLTGTVSVTGNIVAESFSKTPVEDLVIGGMK